MISNITVGSDPEFFIIRKYEDEEYAIPSHEIIPGTKDEPIDFGDGYKVLVDNVLVEGNIPPAKSKEEFIHNMMKLKSIIYEHFLAEMRLELLEADSYEFEEFQLQSREAQTFGCAPYFDAWTRESVYLEGLGSENRRPAGFHIHVGYDLDPSCKYSKNEVNIALTRAFDFFAVEPAQRINCDEFRNKFYGGYGKMRETSYGVEFRGLGSHIAKDQFLGAVYEAVMETMEYCRSEENVTKLLSLKEDSIGTITLQKEVKVLTPVNV